MQSSSKSASSKSDRQSCPSKPYEYKTHCRKHEKHIPKDCKKQDSHCKKKCKSKPAKSDFDLLLDQIMKDNLLDEPCSKYPGLVQATLDHIHGLPDLQPIHDSIRCHLDEIYAERPHFNPLPLTLGAFFFGAYLSSDKYTTSNRYCDPKATFSIPRLTDPTQVCEANVFFKEDAEISVFLDNGKSVGIIHLSDLVDSNTALTTDQVAQLREHGCEKIIIYKSGRKVYEGEIPDGKSHHKPQCDSVKWDFPKTNTPDHTETSPQREHIVHSSNTEQLARDVRHEQPQKEIKGQLDSSASIAVVLALVVIYVWIGAHALR